MAGLKVWAGWWWCSGVANERIERHVLKDGHASVAVLSFGAVTQDWRVRLDGDDIPVVLGFADPEAYRGHSDYMGAILGRVANRIGGASYTQHGHRVELAANDGSNQLHGGPRGLSCVNWAMEPLDARSLRLSHLSPEGANGFPGNVAFEIVMTLNEGRLTYDMRATSDRETPISLSQHNYYNLAGKGCIKGYRLAVRADRVLAHDAQGVTTGAIVDVAGTACDFRVLRALPVKNGQLRQLDDFLLFAPHRDPAQPIAEVLAPNGMRLRMWSDQAGAQLYTGQGMRAQPGGHGAQKLGAMAGLCIEPSGLPNAVNQPNFPSVLVAPEQPYRHVLSVEITAQGG